MRSWLGMALHGFAFAFFVLLWVLFTNIILPELSSDVLPTEYAESWQRLLPYYSALANWVPVDHMLLIGVLRILLDCTLLTVRWILKMIPTIG